MEKESKNIKAKSVLSDNMWHYKLVRYCWDINPTIFKNLCPYFWLTVASLFAVVPITIYKVLKKACVKIRQAGQ